MTNLTFFAENLYTALHRQDGNLKRLLFSLYGFAFFNKFLLLTPVYAIFMQQNGLSDFQLSSMFIISSLATVFGQVPIAFITNHVGQRWAMIFGQFLKSVAVLLWLVFPTYPGFVFGMILWGIQAGFRNVAFEGLVYDSVSANGDIADYPRILGRKSTYESVGVALSALGSLLMFKGYDWVTWASVASILLSVVCLLFVRYTPPEKIRPKKVRFTKILQSGFRVCLKTPCLLSVMLLALLVVNIPYLDDFLSPLGLQLGLPTEYVGILSFFLLGCATLGQRFAYRFTHLPDWFLYLLAGIVGILYVLFSFFYNLDALWLMGIAYILFYGVYTLLYAKLQNMIPLGHRSVVLSLYTTLMYLVYVIVCGIIGLGGQIGSWAISIFVLGVLMIALCAWALLWVRPRCALPAVDKDD